MTFKEKLAIEHQEQLDAHCPGGVEGCPYDYGYETSHYCDHKPSDSSQCYTRWNREIPGTESKLTAISDTLTIKDSGDRTRFDSGAMRDMHSGKGRMDLIPWAAVMEVSKHCEAGANKYGEHNVDKGIPTSSLCDSAARHLAKYLDGWTDEPHLVAAAWNLLWAIQMTVKNPEVVNTPWRKTEE